MPQVKDTLEPHSHFLSDKMGFPQGLAVILQSIYQCIVGCKTKVAIPLISTENNMQFYFLFFHSIPQFKMMNFINKQVPINFNT
jgi:hypothetical protein